MKDISNKEDIKIFVDAFYNKVKLDILIGPVFQSMIAHDDWPVHLERMYSFWYTILFGVPDYRGNPFSKHGSLPLKEKHFNRWIILFQETIDDHFAGAKADEAKVRAGKMSLMFQSKLKHIQQSKGFTNII